MKTLFVTHTQIDPKSWSMIGVSSKPNSTNPIGRFGTGLKYAIAISLRLGWDIKITNYVNGVPDKHVFSLTKDTFRGQDIDVIYDNNTQLPFTAHYGSHWEPWTVLRELYSNTLDEGGWMQFDDVDMHNGSVIEIDSEDFQQLAKNYEDYFLINNSHADSIVYDFGDMQLLNGKYIGKVFFKGVYVGSIKNAAYGYNLESKVELTEDRTIKDEWGVGYAIANIICKHEYDSSFIDWLLSAGKAEESFCFPSFCFWHSTFQDAAVAAKVAHPATLMKNISNNLPKTRTEYVAADLENIHSVMLQQAINKIKSAGFNTNYKIKFVHTEDKHLVAFVENNVIHLSLQAFKNMDYLVSTLIEELAHCEGYADETRSYETYLCDNIARLVSLI